jgi:hypothetical protein
MEKEKHTIEMTPEDILYLGDMFILANQICRDPNTSAKMKKLIGKVSAQYKEQKNGK